LSLRHQRLALAGLAVLALAFALAVPTYPNYDSYFHLNWGRELLAGHAPHIQAYAAPTQHPLFILLAALLDLVFGGVADRALVVVCVLSLVVLVASAFRVGLACFGIGPALGAALFTGSSFAFLLYAARGYVDVPFLALVLVAAALEAERPRRGRVVSGVLVAAGLLRPEAWILAGLYWLWMGWRRFDLLALAAVAPVLWALTDLLLTGDPLFSLHATSALAEELGRERGIAHVPRSFVAFLADTARPPVFAAALLGVALAYRARARLQALHVPLALFAAGTVTFVGTGIGGLSILPRYLTVPAVALCLLAGYAVFGFTTLPRGLWRTRWERGAMAAAVLGFAFLVLKAGSFAALGRELRFIDRTHRAVVATAQDPRVQQCPPVTLPTYRLIPDLRFELDAPESGVRARSQVGLPRFGTALYIVRDEKAIKRFGEAAGVSKRFNVPGARLRFPVLHDFVLAEDRCLGSEGP
jgi:MFS family permease